MSPTRRTGAPIAVRPSTTPGSSAPRAANRSLRRLSFPAGTRLCHDRFEVLGVLGRGGFGITYDVMDHRLQRRVAIKELFPESAVRHGTMVLTPPHARRPVYRDARDRFLREARVLARFTHSGVVRVYEVFEEHNSAYLVMELLEGRTLLDLLNARGRPFSEAEVLDVAARAAIALRSVHTAGVLHRDINPANIVLTDHGRIVVIDFGIARSFVAGHSTPMTAVVTPGYAPIEQYVGERSFRPARPEAATPASRADFAQLIQGSGSTILDHDGCARHFDELRGMFLGFDLLPSVADRVGRPCEDLPLSPEERRRREDEILTAFVDVAALFRRAPVDDDADFGRSSTSEYLFTYLRDLRNVGRGLPEPFVDQLRRTLQHYGVDSLEPSLQLEQALYRIARSQRRMDQQVGSVLTLLERRLDDVNAYHGRFGVAIAPRPHRRRDTTSMAGRPRPRPGGAVPDL